MTDTVDIRQAVVLKTLPGVELMAAGTWKISTGETTFTTEDLAAAVAAVDCPGVRNPVLKLGHAEDDSTGGIRWDGEPAVGWVENMHLTDNGAKIIGDYRGVPAWLAEAMPSAYPDRSVETCRPFLCQIGHLHPFVITALALLGVNPPGIGVLKSLQDVQALYTEASTQPLVVSVAGRMVLAAVTRGAALPQAREVIRLPIRVGDRVLLVTDTGDGIPESLDLEQQEPATASVRVRITGSPQGRRVTLADFNPNQPRDYHGRWGAGLAPGLTDAQLLDTRPWANGRDTLYSDDAELGAWRLLESYAAVETSVTPELVGLADTHGGRMENLGARLKTQESLARKLETKSASKGLTVNQYKAKVADALRYTMIAPPGEYGPTTQAAIDDFRARGYEVEVENTWNPDASYKGINTNMKKDGLVFEVQFHTEDSFRVKTEQHSLYGLVRDPNEPPTPAQRAAATATMLANATSLDTPTGALQVASVGSGDGR